EHTLHAPRELLLHRAERLLLGLGIGAGGRLGPFVDLLQLRIGVGAADRLFGGLGVGVGEVLGAEAPRIAGAGDDVVRALRVDPLLLDLHRGRVRALDGDLAADEHAARAPLRPVARVVGPDLALHQLALDHSDAALGKRRRGGEGELGRRPVAELGPRLAGLRVEHLIDAAHAARRLRDGLALRVDRHATEVAVSDGEAGGLDLVEVLPERHLAHARPEVLALADDGAVRALGLLARAGRGGRAHALADDGEVDDLLLRRRLQVFTGLL